MSVNVRKEPQTHADDTHARSSSSSRPRAGPRRDAFHHHRARRFASPRRRRASSRTRPFETHKPALEGGPREVDARRR